MGKKMFMTLFTEAWQQPQTETSTDPRILFF